LKRLIAYRERTLPAAEHEAVQEHLSLCSHCTGLLLELRDFQSAVAKGEAGPESLRQEAWESLVRRLPGARPVVRPIAGASRREAQRPWRGSPILAGAAATLLLAVAGLAGWAMVTVREQRQRLASLEQRLNERDAKLAALESALAGEEELAAKVAELTASVEALRRTPVVPRGGIAHAAQQIAVAVSPRFALRGQQTSESGVLRGEGEINSVRMPRADERFAVTLRLPDQPSYEEYRFELLDRDGKVLWSGRRPGRSVLGDAGTSVSVTGVGPGLYRLRIEGVSPVRIELLGEYVLNAERSPGNG
jgi:hypothetical protein